MLFPENHPKPAVGLRGKKQGVSKDEGRSRVGQNLCPRRKRQAGAHKKEIHTSQGGKKTRGTGIFVRVAKKRKDCMFGLPKTWGGEAAYS